MTNRSITVGGERGNLSYKDSMKWHLYFSYIIRYDDKTLLIAYRETEMSEKDTKHKRVTAVYYITLYTLDYKHLL